MLAKFSTGAEIFDAYHKKIGNPCKSRVSVVRETGLEASPGDKFETI